MSHFFRYEMDGEPHLNVMLIYVIFAVSIAIAVKFRKNEKLLKAVLIISVALQAVMFAWYLGDKALLIKEGLSLYHCRLAALMSAAGYFFNKPKVARFFAWMGLVGAVIAFVFPDPSDFMWPHLTNLTFVSTHCFIAMGSIMVIARNDVKLCVIDACVMTVVMNAFLVIVNAMLGSNYGYLTELPPGIPLQLNKYMLFVLLTAVISGGEPLLDRAYAAIKMHD